MARSKAFFGPAPHITDETMPMHRSIFSLPHSVFALSLSVSLAAAAIAGDDDFRRERKPANQEAKDGLEGKAPPALEVENWINTDAPLEWSSLQGKVVLIDFWGVWCGPCRRAIPHLKELYEKHHAEGLVVIGVHTTGSSSKMPEYVEEEKIPYPVAADVDKKTVRAFHVDSFPDYYLIDRSGKLRFADLANKEVDRAVELLLQEKPSK